MPRFCAPLTTLLIAVLLSACDDIPDLSLPNVPPQAVDDSVELRQDAVIDISIGANDVDLDGNVSLIEIATDPEHGSAEVVGNLVRYTPDRLYAGPDTFDYRITDTLGESDEATVSITVKQRQTRALFTVDTAAMRRLYMLDSRQPDTAIALSATLEATESVRDWAYYSAQQQAVVLTDADRIGIIPLSDPNAAVFFPIELGTDETVDGGFDVSASARQAAYSVNNRFVRTFDLITAAFDSVDTGWTDSTMEILAFSPIGTSVLMTGTLGDPAVAAFYLVTTAGTAPVQLFEGDDAVGTISARSLPTVNNVSDTIWLLEQPGSTEIGPFSCAQPPAQRLSSLSYVSLLSISNIIDLNATSGLLPDPTDIISYNPSSAGRRVFVAACPSGADIVQLIEIPFTNPATARVVATGNDPSDKLYSVDVASDGLSLIYAVDGDTGLRPVYVDLSDTAAGAVSTDLTSAAPQFQTFAAGADVLAPASALSTDTRRWVFVAPDSGEPTLLTWVELDELTSATTTLPFATTEAPLSDGYLAFVSTPFSEPISDAYASVESKVALVRLDGTPAAAVTLPGTLTGADGALAVAPIVFAPVALADSP